MCSSDLRISDLEDRMVEFTSAEQTKEKRMKRNEDSLRDLWDNIKSNNIHIIGVPEGEEKTNIPLHLGGQGKQLCIEKRKIKT